MSSQATDRAVTPALLVTWLTNTLLTVPNDTLSSARSSNWSIRKQRFLRSFRERSGRKKEPQKRSQAELTVGIFGIRNRDMAVIPLSGVSGVRNLKQHKRDL